jgi:hypothetical protein
MSTNQVRRGLLKPLNFGVKHVKRHSNGTVGGPWCQIVFFGRGSMLEPGVVENHG